MTMVHPVVTRNDIARLDLGEDAALQALQRGIGRAITQKARANIEA
jgi:hypothetical protein